MPINPNETTVEQVARLVAELQAMEQDAMEELRKVVEEAQQKA